MNKARSNRTLVLKNTIENAQRELGRLEAEMAQEDNRKLLGKCYKYRNSYSCPEKPSDYWWLYRRVVGIQGVGLRVAAFQIDRLGKIQITPSEYCPSIYNGHVPITETEFCRAWRRTLKVIGQKGDTVFEGYIPGESNGQETEADRRTGCGGYARHGP